MDAGKRTAAHAGRSRACWRSGTGRKDTDRTLPGRWRCGGFAGRRSGCRGEGQERIMGHREGSQMVGALRIKGLVLMLVLFGLAVAACAPPGSSSGGGSGGGGGEEAQQKVEKSGGGGPVCDVKPPNIDGLGQATVGFSQSEEETNPFRIAETQSIRDEAQKVGVEKLIVTNAASQIGKQNSDIQDMLAQGAQVLILEGTPGASVTTDRQNGFVDQLEAEYPNMEVVASQTANFVRTEGQTVMEQLLQSNPDLTAVYAHNDEMALGAVQAIRDAGKEPGKDIKIVSIDGTEGAVQALAQGQLNGVVESNPRFGPLAFQTVEKFLNGDSIPQKIIISDRIYTPENAEENLDAAY